LGALVREPKPQNGIRLPHNAVAVQPRRVRCGGSGRAGDGADHLSRACVRGGVLRVPAVLSGPAVLQRALPGQGQASAAAGGQSAVSAQ
jgi:hypothetical protein